MSIRQAQSHNKCEYAKWAESDVIEPELGQEPGALGVYLPHG